MNLIWAYKPMVVCAVVSVDLQGAAILYSNSTFWCSGFAPEINTKGALGHNLYFLLKGERQPWLFSNIREYCFIGSIVDNHSLQHQLHVQKIPEGLNHLVL